MASLDELNKKYGVSTNSSQNTNSANFSNTKTSTNSQLNELNKKYGVSDNKTTTIRTLKSFPLNNTVQQDNTYTEDTYKKESREKKLASMNLDSSELKEYKRLNDEMETAYKNYQSVNEKNKSSIGNVFSLDYLLNKDTHNEKSKETENAYAAYETAKAKVEAYPETVEQNREAKKTAAQMMLAAVSMPNPIDARTNANITSGINEGSKDTRTSAEIQSEIDTAKSQRKTLAAALPAWGDIENKKAVYAQRELNNELDKKIENDEDALIYAKLNEMTPEEKKAKADNAKGSLTTTGLDLAISALNWLRTNYGENWKSEVSSFPQNGAYQDVDINFVRLLDKLPTNEIENLYALANDSASDYQRYVELLQMSGLADEIASEQVKAIGNSPASGFNKLATAVRSSGESGLESIGEIENIIKRDTRVKPSMSGSVSNALSVDSMKDVPIAEGGNLALKNPETEKQPTTLTDVYGVAGSVGQMLVPMAVSIITKNEHIGNGVFALQAGGAAYREAINAGHEYSGALGYSAAQAVDETVTNELLGGIAKFGGGKLKSVLGNTKYGQALVNGIDSLATTKEGAAALKIAENYLSNATSEAAQEFMQYFTEGLQKEIFLGEEFDVDMEEAWKAAALGAITSAIMNTATGEAVSYAKEGASKFTERQIESATNDIIKSGEDGIDPEKYKSLTAEDMEEVANRVNEKYDETGTPSSKAITEKVFTEVEKIHNGESSIDENLTYEEIKDVSDLYEQRYPDDKEKIDTLKEIVKEKKADRISEATSDLINGEEIDFEEKYADLNNEEDKAEISRIYNEARSGLKKPDFKEATTTHLIDNDGEEVTTSKEIKKLKKEESAKEPNVSTGTTTNIISEKNNEVETKAGTHAKKLQTAEETNPATKTEINEGTEGKLKTAEAIQDDAVVNKVEKAVEKVSGTKETTVDTSKVNYKVVSRKQKVQMAIVNGIAKTAGLNVSWYTSKVDEKGNFTGDNGSYDASTRTIYLDTNGGADNVLDTSKIINVASHEIAHSLKTSSREHYDDIKNTIIDSLKSEGSYDSRLSDEVDRIKERNKEDGKEATENDVLEEAIDELVARSCEDILYKNGYAKQILSQMREEARETFIGRVKDFINKVTGVYDAALKSVDSNSEEAVIIRKNKEAFKKVADKFDSAMKELDKEATSNEKRNDSRTVNSSNNENLDGNKSPKFYSKLTREIESMNQEKSSASSVVSYLKGKGVKDEEIKWSGIESFLDGKKSVSKDDLVKFARENEIEIKEEKRSEYGDYKLNGGSNYREYIYKIPGSDYSNDSMVAHWGKDAKGIVAHARVQDFTTADGKKVLFIEEIQSDWHNEGHKRGYKEENSEVSKLKKEYKFYTEENKDTIDKISSKLVDEASSIFEEQYYTNRSEAEHDIKLDLLKNGSDSFPGIFNGILTNEKFLSAEEETVVRTIDSLLKRIRNANYKSNSKVEYAPFKDTYTDFVLKSLIRDAAENNYDFIAWTTGKMQEERWSDKYAEGYRIEYDQQIPSFLKKYVKQWDSEVSTIDVGEYKAPAINITDSMKESVIYDGQRVFSHRNNNKSTTERTTAEDKKIEALKKKYGVIPKGENAVAHVGETPRKTSDDKYVSNFMNTLIESGSVPDALIPDLQKLIIKEAASHEMIGNKEEIAEANDIFDKRGIDGLRKEWDDKVKSGKELTAYDSAYGQKAILEYMKAGDVKNTIELVTDMLDKATNYGQVVQSFRLLKKMAAEYPEVGIAYIQKSAKNLSDEFGKKVSLDNNLVKNYLNAKTKSEIDTAQAAIYEDMSKQLPRTVESRLRAWRYLAMLGNPKTHVRNFIGNAIFLPAVKLKNILATGMEKTIKKEGRTKAIFKTKESVEFAKKDFLEVKDALQGNKVGSIEDDIKRLKREKPFSGKGLVGKVLNGLSSFNSKALEFEDAIFLKHYYTDSLAQFITARKLDVNNITQSQLAQAREYAIREAQKATYRDASALANALNIIKDVPYAGIMLEGIMPYKKTPVNILKRGVEYSPLGIISAVKEVATTTYQNSKKDEKYRKKIDKANIIDSLASSMSGSMIMLLGGYLASLGLIKGGYDDDDDKVLSKLEGQQEYSFNVGKLANDHIDMYDRTFGTKTKFRFGDVNYTIDWAAPTVMPFFAGVAAYNMLKKENDGMTFSMFADSMVSMLKPLSKMSFLEGVEDTIQSVKNSDNPLGSAALATFLSFLGQNYPTISGQIARTVDTTQRVNYQDINGWMKNKDVLYFIEKMQNKTISSALTSNNLWGISSTDNDPYLDEWGRENTTDSHLLAGLENFLSPGYVSETKNDKVTEEIKRLNKAQSEETVVPSKVKKYYEYKDKEGNKVRVDLTSEEWTKWQRTAGSTAYDIIDNMIDDDRYDWLSSEQQAKAIAYAYDYSVAVGRKEIQEGYKSSDKWIESAISSYESSGKQAYDTILDKVTAEIVDDSIPKGTSGYSSVANSNFTDEQKSAWLNNNSSMTDSEDYNAWKNVGGTDADYIDHKANLTFPKGTDSDEKREKVIEYIKGYDDDTRRVLWQIAGYGESTYEDYFGAKKLSAPKLSENKLKAKTLDDVAKPLKK